ncbi:MAG: hypothetical protein ACRC6A_08000 [Fusobacteriaceae bacterium]
MDLNKVFDAINKFGFAVVLAGLFIYNSIEGGHKLDRLHAEYLASQKQDRQEYVALNMSMVETLNKMSTAINSVSKELSNVNNRLDRLERGK